MRVITKTGSIYQVDKDKKRIRKLSQPIPFESKRITSEWKSFDAISNILIGRAMVIFWPHDDPPVDGMDAAFTTTNIVISVTDDQPDIN